MNRYPESKHAVIPGDGECPDRVTEHGRVMLAQVRDGLYAYSRYVGSSGGFQFADGRLMTHYQAENLILLWQLLHTGFLTVGPAPREQPASHVDRLGITPKGVAALNGTAVTTKGATHNSTTTRTREGTAA